MGRLVGKDYVGWFVSWDKGQKEFSSERKALSFARGKVGTDRLVTIKKVTYSDSKLWCSWIRGTQTMKNGRITRNSIQHPNWKKKEKGHPDWKGRE